MSLLNLGPVPVPPEVYRVEGCTCGGGPDSHRENCGIFAVPVEKAREAVAAARQRMRDHSAELNRRLQAELAALTGDRGSRDR